MGGFRLQVIGIRYQPSIGRKKLKMFGEKPFHKLDYDDLTAFLQERREENVRLDYKESWTNKIIETACAFANTYGGYLFYGVKEIEQQNRPNQPAPDDIPGIDFSKGDPAASIRSKILDNIRPTLEFEIKSIPLKGSIDKGVLILQIEESTDAPHEVLLPGGKRIPVRRADTTDSASLDEIEQLIRQRDEARSEREQTLDLQFFEEELSEPPDAWNRREVPPTIGFMIQPRRINSLSFGFDSKLDRAIRNIALQNNISDNFRTLPIPSGLALKDQSQDPPTVRLEVHKNGLIRGAKALSVYEKESKSSEHRQLPEKWLSFEEISLATCSIVRFAGQTYALRRSGVEMEVWFGLSECQGHKAEIPLRSRTRQGVPFPSRSGEISSSLFHPRLVVQSVLVETNIETGEPTEESLLELIREISRFFQISTDDEYLRLYIK